MEILGKKVTLTRRRYGNQTFTWAAVEIEGKRYELGDPWPAVTPKRAALELAVQDIASLVRSRYFELEAACLPLIESYQADLTTHDRNAMIRQPGVPYLHWTRKWGTHMELLDDADSYPPPGVRVPYLFGTADREHILNQVVVMAVEYFLNPCNPETLAVHHFDGRKLRRITVQKAADVVRNYAAGIRREWANKARAA